MVTARSELPAHARDWRARLLGRDAECEALADLYADASRGELDRDLAAVVRALVRRMPAEDVAALLASAALIVGRAGP